MQLNRGQFNGAAINGTPSIFKILAVRWRLVRPAIYRILSRAASSVLPKRLPQPQVSAAPKQDIPRVSRG